MSAKRERLVLAVFVAKAYAKQLSRNEPVYDAQIYAQAAKQRDVKLYYFTVDDVLLSSKRRKIWGWCFTGSEWVYRRVPWPHMVFDQVVDPEEREKRTVKQLRRSKYFTWLGPRGGLPKWYTHRIVARHSRLARLLPEERLLRSVADLLHMLSRHDSVLVKPNYGSRGRGITLIWQEKEGLYGLRYSGREEAATGLTLHQVMLLARAYAQEKQPVITQQIPLLRIGKRLTDIRVIVGKNRQGQWLPVLSLMRIGKEGSFVTNWSMGAQEIPLAQGLEAAGLPTSRVEALVNHTLEIALEMAQVLEATRGPLIEIGLDLAFDTNLRLWFIEANASPGKGAQKAHPIPPAFACVVDGALYLWNTRNKGPSGKPKNRRGY